MEKSLNKLPFDQKFTQINPLIDAINSLLDRIEKLEEAKKQEVPAILKPKIEKPAKGQGVKG